MTVPLQHILTCTEKGEGDCKHRGHDLRRVEVRGVGADAALLALLEPTGCRALETEKAAEKAAEQAENLQTASTVRTWAQLVQAGQLCRRMCPCASVSCTLPSSVPAPYGLKVPLSVSQGYEALFDHRPECRKQSPRWLGNHLCSA